MSESWLARLLGTTAKVTVRFVSPTPPGLSEEVPPRSPSPQERPQALQNTCATSHWHAETTREGLAEHWPTIAGYEILAELGRGGMGVVYLARQCSLGRPVALKMIHAHSLDQAEACQRFRTEVEAAARLHHPNIVQIYDVGTWNNLPYFCMEYMEGGSLDGYLQRRPQPPKAAARIVEILALAAHHAHLNGIIHRDLKPSNVLLSRDGVPKISDFGLAKQLEQAGTTKTGEVMGTPSYMSPEQTTSGGRNVGPATDIYSLGAMLYEMLTGRPPFLGSNLLETVLLVRLQDPVPPRRMQPGIPRDLETICLKCLEKSPARRYPTAAALAEDLRRFQAGEPIQARPSNLVERAWKWSQRRPAVAALLAAVVVAGVSLLALGVYHVRSVERERLRAEENHLRAVAEAEFARSQKAEADRQRLEALALQQLAETNYQLARKGVEELLAVVRDNPQLQNPENAEIRQALTQKALIFYQALIAQASKDPNLRAEEANACWRLADCLDEVGNRADSARFYQRAVDIYTALADAQPESDDFRFKLAQTCVSLGWVRNRLGEGKDAVSWYARAEQVLRELLAKEPDNPEYLHVMSKVLSNTGAFYLEGLPPAPESADSYLTRALDIDRALLVRYPKDERFQVKLSHDLNLYGWHARLRGRFSEAEAAFRESLTINRDLATRHPQSSHYSYPVANALSALGFLHRHQGFNALAEAELFEALDILEPLADQTTRQLAALTALGNVLNELGSIFFDRGSTDEALKWYERSSTYRAEVLRRQPESVEARVSLAGSYCNQGHILRDRRGYTAALALFNQAEELLRTALEHRPRNRTARLYLRNTYWGRAELHELQSRYEDALRDLDRAMALDVTDSAGAPADLLLQRAKVLVHAKRCDEALRITEETLRESSRVTPHNLYQAAQVYAAAAASCSVNDPEAARLYRDALSHRAVQLLNEAAEYGYFARGVNPADQLKLPEFDVLRDRADFQNFCRRFQVRF